MAMDSGHEVTLLEGKELEQQQRDFTAYRGKGLVRFTPGRWLLTEHFTKFANKIYNFKWRSSDVAVMTYPKCGTTWTQEIIWTMRNNANLNHPGADESIMTRASFIEFDMFQSHELTWDSPIVRSFPAFQRLCPDADPNDGVFLQIAAALPDPRTIKTHLPFSFFHPSLLDTGKVVYVARNPKDVLVSFCHHSRLMSVMSFAGTMEDFYKYFSDGDLLFGSYDLHVKEAWERRTHPNLLFMFYEDMQADIMKELRRLNDFMDTKLTEEQLKKMAMESGHEVTFLEGEELEQQKKDFTGYRIRGLVRFTPGRWLLPAHVTKFANKIFNFKWRSSDMVVMTYPKCGTTWAQEIIWTMRNNVNFDHPDADEFVMARAPFIEFDMFLPGELTRDSPLGASVPAFQRLCPDADPNDGVYLQIAAATPDPRTIKTHLSFSFFHPSLLDTAKVVYVARNPKDMLVSYCHHSRLLSPHGFVGKMEDFYKYFSNGDLVYGSYDLHVKEAWERRTHPNLLFMFYEDMQADIMKELRRLNDFLDTKLTEEQLKKVADYTSFTNMKARGEPHMKNFGEKEVLEEDGGFFRKGKSGDWKNSLSPEIAEQMDAWTAKHINFGVTFKYE